MGTVYDGKGGMHVVYNWEYVFIIAVAEASPGQCTRFEL
jgi:hypothetical protein